jgi:hypothetical protein
MVLRRAQPARLVHQAPHGGGLLAVPADLLHWATAHCNDEVVEAATIWCDSLRAGAREARVTR